jgi:hypothetical protein
LDASVAPTRSARKAAKAVAWIERSEIRGGASEDSRISRSLSSGAHSRDPLVQSGLRSSVQRIFMSLQRNSATRYRAAMLFA